MSLLVGDTNTLILHWASPDLDCLACNCIRFSKPVTSSAFKDTPIEPVIYERGTSMW
uniref:Phenylalanyl-tRNA synthetase beta chain n=1 Tax=Rhizophora mucronata TaxID=61149 RepID=A0A2P2MTR7_RHIMU